jgi:hypothetical protein
MNIHNNNRSGKTLRAIDLIKQAIANNPKKDFIIFTNSESQKSFIKAAFGNGCNVVVVPMPKPSAALVHSNFIEDKIRGLFQDNCMVLSRTMIDKSPDILDWATGAIKAYPGFKYFYKDYQKEK